MRRICIVTGTRAEYGLLSKLMSLADADKDVELQVLVTGMHLSEDFGMTVKEIEADGLPIAARVEMLEPSDSPCAMAKSTARGLAGCAGAFESLRPDIVVVLGDRFETLAAAEAALFARIPLAHISGGERTEGAIDEAMRHAMTKMAQLHFPSTDEYARRIMQLGESPERVFNVGALNVDVIASTALMGRDALEWELGVKFKGRNLLCTFHPETLEIGMSPRDQVEELFKALDRIEDCFTFFTMPNADSGGAELGRLIGDYVSARQGRAGASTSLGRVKYFSLMNVADAVVGNSSSGLTEAPSFRKPTVNIGDRQKGRIRARSVIDCPAASDAISSAIAKALSSGFKDSIKDMESPFGKPGASARMLEILKEVELDGILKKRFQDLPYQALF